MFKSLLLPWKHTKTKVMVPEQTMEDDQVLQEQKLSPCSSCGRTFLPQALKKHAPICEKNAVKKRKVFDSLKQRVEGTDLAQFHQKTYLKRQESTPKTAEKSNKRTSKWEENHQKLVDAIRSAKGVSRETDMSSNKKPQPLSSSNERCPFCERQFGPKAFDRHVEWCKEHRSRVQKSPANILLAKERLEARIKYRVPPLNKSKRSVVKEKYSNNSINRTESVCSVKSTPSSISSVKNPLVRKPRSVLDLGTATHSKIEKNKNEGAVKSLRTKRVCPREKINSTNVNGNIDSITVSQLKLVGFPGKKMVTWRDISEKVPPEEDIIVVYENSNVFKKNNDSNGKFIDNLKEILSDSDVGLLKQTNSSKDEDFILQKEMAKNLDQFVRDAKKINNFTNEYEDDLQSSDSLKSIDLEEASSIEEKTEEKISLLDESFGRFSICDQNVTTPLNEENINEDLSSHFFIDNEASIKLSSAQIRKSLSFPICDAKKTELIEIETKSISDEDLEIEDSSSFFYKNYCEIVNSEMNLEARDDLSSFDNNEENASILSNQESNELNKNEEQSSNFNEETHGEENLICTEQDFNDKINDSLFSTLSNSARSNLSTQQKPDLKIFHFGKENQENFEYEVPKKRRKLNTTFVIESKDRKDEIVLQKNNFEGEEGRFKRRKGKKNCKIKKEIDCPYLSYRSFGGGAGDNQKSKIKKNQKPEIETDSNVKPEDLFTVDDKMYAEYKIYEEMYLKEKEQKTQSKKQKSKISPKSYGIDINNDDTSNQTNKISDDSAYGSLNRNTPKPKTAKLSPLQRKRINSASSSGSENLPISPINQQRMSKFCHECGNKYPLTTAKFCVECGVKRLVL